MDAITNTRESKMTTTICTIRANQVKYIPNCTVRQDGTIWYQDMALLDRETPGCDSAQIVALATAKRYAEIPQAAYCRLGTMPSGLRVLTKAEYDAEQTPALAAIREQYLTHECTCDRCGAHVDGHTAYHQQQWTRLGSNPAKYTAYYCTTCAATLQAIGAGEHTAMQERAGDVPSYEPTTKED